MTTIQYKKLQRSRVGFIAVHCSATPPSRDLDVDDIRRMHLQRGFLDVGYHFVIKRDGTVQMGRPLDRQGAHVSRFNHLSIGVCLIGGVSDKDVNVPENNFTPAQFAALHELLKRLHREYPAAVVQGHRDFPFVHKACPSFDVREWLKSHPLE